MANQEKVNKTEGQATEQQQVQTPAQTGTPVQQQVEVKTEEKMTIGKWLKKHWKGVTATVVGVGTAVGTSIAAYRKGKAAGANGAMPIQETEDYSLNPNE